MELKEYASEVDVDFVRKVCGRTGPRDYVQQANGHAEMM